MATAFYKEQAVVEILTELNLGQARRDTGMLGSILSQVGLNQLQESLKGEKILDQANEASFNKMNQRVKAADEHGKTSRKNVLDSFKDFEKAGQSVKPLETGKDDMPDFAAHQARELQASQQNLTEYVNRLNQLELGIDVKKDATGIGDDIGATMGMKVEDRQLGISVQEDMLQGQKQIQTGLKNELLIRGHNIKVLKEGKEQLEEQKAAEEARLKSMKKSSPEYKRQEAFVGRINNSLKSKNDAIKKEEQYVDNVNAALEISKLREEDLIRTKDKALNVDRALKAVEREQRQEENKAYREWKEEQREIADIKKRQQQLDRVRNKLAREYNINIQSMADKFKTTLVSAMAISTGAVMAFYYKFNMIVESFKEFEKELINAQSIFQTNQETLFGLSDEVVKFGTKYGIEMNKASEGLYQLASAGLSAEESMLVLNNTLKLSMAVQGDHNALSKLTVQTIYGFGLQMSDSAELTDKFAHAINKSLIEWDDLASSVKFAMPFFITTGQSVDQLLGSLEILTNRALEAGIAGRGLRQALAMFAKHADDNSAAFRKMGVEILDAEGNFKELTTIAKEFSDAMGPAANDTELLTKLLEDLNVRGATAFIHLVQNADEFEAAVADLANSSGAATEMANIQQESLANSIQRVKNAIRAPFLLSDEIGKAHGFMNEFAMQVHNVVDLFESLFVVVEDGITTGLTPLGENIKDFLIVALKEFAKIAIEVKNLFLDMTDNGKNFGKLLGMITIPLRLMVRLLKYFGAEFIETIILFKVINGVLPITNMLISARIMLMDKELIKDMKSIWAKKGLFAANGSLAASYAALALSQAGVMVVMFSMIYFTRKMGEGSEATAAKIGGLAGAILGIALALQIYQAVGKSFTPMHALLVIGASIAAFAGLNVALQRMMTPPEVTYPSTPYGMEDTGGYIYADAGRGRGLGSRHKPVLVEPGESITSKTQNMLTGGANGGITLNIHGDVYDADNFAERLSEVLPQALRKANDTGGI